MSKKPVMKKAVKDIRRARRKVHSAEPVLQLVEGVS